MTSAAAKGTGRRRAEGRGYGLVLFASVLLLVVGCLVRNSQVLIPTPERLASAAGISLLVGDPICRA
jgi:hypothetical protein